MSELWNQLSTGNRTQNLSGGLADLFASARVYFDILLGGAPNEGRCADLSNLQAAGWLRSVIVSPRMLDLNLRIRTFHFNFVMALLHIVRRISQEELPSDQHI